MASLSGHAGSVHWQGSWVLSPSALRRYLGKGHAMPGCEELPALEPASDQMTDDERRALRRLWLQRGKEEEDFSRAVCMSMFRFLRDQAPPHIKQRLIIPCYVIRAVRHHVLHKIFELQVIIPTFPRTPTAASASREGMVEVYQQDYERRNIFIEACNSLIADEVLRAEVGLTEADFTFSLVPVEAVHKPVFTRKEIKELIENPSLADLYGTTSAFQLLGLLSATPRDCKRLDNALKLFRRQDAPDAT
ncbi:hypothetical protein OH77DRAFT_1418133 [Trametes cingulata]|nr:hypothetical protein OH77DRAFT_1418133 [Trametes cingulata]